MKLHIGPNTVITALLAVLLLSAAACSDRNAQARLAMAAADSLMTADPQAALDTLMTIDSTDAAGLPRADRALYTLLRTEAEYKCYMPVAGNTTAISEAADYYRRKGPEDLLARALVMQGAVLFEQGDTDGAMLAYKEAEPLLEHSGDPEQLGLLHTHIASLYQYNIFNTEEAIVRYRKALECFDKAGLSERVMYTHLSLASSFMGIDEDSVLSHLKTGMDMARTSNNRQCGIYAHVIYSSLYNSTNKDTLVIKAADRFFSEYGNVPLSQTEISQYNGIYHNAAFSCLNTGMYTKAEELANMIVPSSAVDSLVLYSIRYDIAVAHNNLDSIKTYKIRHERLFEKILRDDYESYILEIEKRYDNEVLINKLKISKSRTAILSAVLLLVVAIFIIVYLLLRNRTAKKEMTLRNAVNDLQSLRTELLSKQDETTRLHSRLHDTEAAMEHLKKQIETEAKKHNQEAEELKNLRESFVSQVTSNQELLALNGKILGMTKTLADICYIYEGSPNMPGKVEEAVKSILSDEDTLNNILGKMLELTYPGFMTGLSKEYPSLNDSDRKLIVLTCCGFSSSTASVILGISVQNLNARKYRIARKMGIDGRISSFMKKKLSEYSAPIIKPA